MSQNPLSAITTLHTLVFATMGLCWIGNVDPVLAQIESGVPQPPPPPQATADNPATVAAIDVIDRDATNELESNELGSNELGYRALLQGPVHEAFASQADSGVILHPRVHSEKPPANVREQPPEDRPVGDNLLWIPGYWSWDDQAAKYVWVSGVYRKVPPGRTWVPGYWSTRGEGYQWTSGFWSSTRAGVDDQVYLPPPPQSIDNGPSVPPPDDDFFWLPGSWEYDDGGYWWRSGYWTRHYEGWVWQPDCYITTPHGYVYNTGYWDLLPPDRGMLYSPVEFDRPVYLNPGFVYRPRLPLANSAALLLNLFVRRGHPGFYYGNYYGPSYASLGYQPWYDLGYGSGGFGSRYAVPWLSYYDWNYGQRGFDFRGSMGRYKNYYGKPDRGGSKSVKIDADIAKFAKNGKPERRSGDNAVRGSLDDIVLRDFNGQSPPRVDRQAKGKSSKHVDNFSTAKPKNNFDSQRGSNAVFTPSQPKHDNPKHSTRGMAVENQGKKSQAKSSSTQTFDRGRSPSSIEHPQASSRSPGSFGRSDKGNGKSVGGGNSGKGGGGKGNSGKGGGKGGGKK
ncbi:hypothetical protein [Novipirellula caenicola]|uniref:YXWGXW repeat (2 copies) n=1 Tax=Novipirellula caenicola TaxID=1536901 RepID=A0ABP9VS44_9BACT